mmetsp:Transcript_20819/g.26871  ORF Transcript_20819/g.26871 Transcript_20819/m.26871 type:complete len:363 (+) Transcript_20819:171-1259(+)|eukprot:CAMPEP_0116060226 /NCGR_PEP_ID=MMETSP0322-20121206/6281_1 /TAXON_ID=163516 /ORGANISM="Leptocylindrus danicus var. apora, Strain B651" /LENGTH=362 /DNA_ID=CAMNT_0003544789 /DNA_START=110 /DNA_END=1198 /DNA_ORIENTATION=+
MTTDTNDMEIDLPPPKGKAMPWVEKYRPKDLSAVAHQEQVTKTLQSALQSKADAMSLPHLLFYGPPGTGKTSLALALCRQLWHPDMDIKQRVLELNASDERGISVVRDKIKTFAGLSVGNSMQAKLKNGDSDDEKFYPNPSFKIIILDEADTVTPDAQAALRRVIEAHSKVTRFILICNYVTRIIEPLASRCAKFRFQPLPHAAMKNRLLTISESEECKIGDDALEEILSLSGGDMRKAVNALQSAQNLTTGKQEIKADSVAEMAGFPPSTLIDRLLKSLKTGSFEKMQVCITDILAEGFSVIHILTQLFEKILVDDSLNDTRKAQIAIKIAEANKCLVDGADEFLQIMSVCSLILNCCSAD